MPLDLAAVLKRFPRLLARLATLDPEGDDRSDDDRSRPRQVDHFRSQFASCVRKAA
jgi:hypothetical protein